MSLNVRWEADCALLELNHGKANLMGSAQLDAFTELCERLEEGRVRCLITWSSKVSSRGKAIFIAGADVTERVGWTQEQVAQHVRRQREVLARLRAAPVFHVAVVHGVALGWGTEYLLCCDYRIATPQAIFGLPETGLGILPGAGGTSELAQLIGLPQALRLGMTGERIGAEEAERIGLVQERSPSPEQGLERARSLAQRVGRNSPTAVAAFKRGSLAAQGMDSQTRRELEAQAYEHCLQSGEAAIGRAHFKAILAGEPAPWGPLTLPES